MCGIAGIIGNDAAELTRSMLQAIKHRGPDDTGLYQDGGCAIGMNRLSILDLSYAAHQPMKSDDGRFTIVYNGEIYNYRELKEGLIKLGYQFNSGSDTEVLLKGYIAYGADILQKIRGMFAFVIWDNQEKTAFGARDHLGIKPFLYHFENGVFTFCSEMKGFLQVPYIPKKLSSKGLQLYLSYGYVGAPYTILDQVFALRPGEYFTISGNELNIASYWDIPAHRKTSLSYDDAKAKVKNLVLDSVKEELVSDVPLGLFLSGGLDSTVVLAAMRDAGKEKIDTFSIGFEKFDASEEEDARIAADFYQTNHHTHIISGKTVAEEFDGFIEAMDQPCIDGLNVYFVSKFTSKNVTVALSGLGPDELFLGYKWQRSAVAPGWFSQPMQTIFTETMPVLHAIWPKRYISVLNYLKQVQNPVEYYTQLNRIFTEKEVAQIIGAAYHPSLNADWVKSYDLPDEQEIYSRISRLDMKLFMGARVLGISDATSMYHSLEVRFPLIDKRLVEFSRTLPPQYKMDLAKAAKIRPWSRYEGNESYEGSGVKRILYEAFKDKLPQGFGTRAKKGFKFPFNQWISTELRQQYADTLNPVNHTGSLKQLVEKLVSRQTDQNKWSIYILVLWLKKYNIEQ